MPNLATYGTFALAGMAGAIIRQLMDTKGSILLMKVWEKDGRKGVDLGILGAMLVGAAVGVVIDSHPLTAFFGALSGSMLLEELARKQKLPPGPPPGD